MRKLKYGDLPRERKEEIKEVIKKLREKGSGAVSGL